MEKELKEPIELFGYECGEGWLPLVKEAEDWIKEYNNTHKQEHIDSHSEELRFLQVKEKFGMLTIYCNYYPEGLHDKLMDLEQRSLKICERCGETDGTTCESSHGWIFTLCPECRKKENERWEKKKMNVGINFLTKTNENF